jgi:hypothetical protein
MKHIHKRNKKRADRAKVKLDEVVKAAREAGANVTFSLKPKEMPTRWPNDPEPVKLLITESERVSALGNNWMTADIPNPVAAEMCHRNGWAYSLAAAWLRCKLKGEIT